MPDAISHSDRHAPTRSQHASALAEYLKYMRSWVVPEYRIEIADHHAVMSVAGKRDVIERALDDANVVDLILFKPVAGEPAMIWVERQQVGVLEQT
jgi:hypothetical protein